MKQNSYPLHAQLMVISYTGINIDMNDTNLNIKIRMEQMHMIWIVIVVTGLVI